MGFKHYHQFGFYISWRWIFLVWILILISAEAINSICDYLKNKQKIKPTDMYFTCVTRGNPERSADKKDCTSKKWKKLFFVGLWTIYLSTTEFSLSCFVSPCFKWPYSSDTNCSTRKSKMEKAFRTALLYIQKTFCSLYRRWWKTAIQSLQFSVINLLSPFTLSFLYLERICESWFLSFMSLFMSLRVYYWLKARVSDRLEVAQDL